LKSRLAPDSGKFLCAPRKTSSPTMLHMTQAQEALLLLLRARASCFLLLLSGLFLWVEGANLASCRNAQQAALTADDVSWKAQAARELSFRAREAFRASEGSEEVQEEKREEWGNHDALVSCFGENYKTAGVHDSIGHCFHEHDTHNTCCMLDQEARDLNDKAGNPIGQASLDAYLKLNPDKKDSDHTKLLTPWCTCFFSQVCSFYAVKTKSKVKFVNDCGCSHGTPGLGFCLGQIPKNETYNCEGWARESFRAPSHATPGVEVPPDGSHCSPLEGKKEVNVSTCTLEDGPAAHTEVLPGATDGLAPKSRAATAAGPSSGLAPKSKSRAPTAAGPSSGLAPKSLAPTAAGPSPVLFLLFTLALSFASRPNEGA